MTTLALEFSSDKRSASLLNEGLFVAEAVHVEEGHTPVIALVRRVLEQAGISRESVKRIAVGLGPGSYAGIRLALAFAQGWSLKGGVDVVGVSSLEALIHGIPGDNVMEGTSALVLVDAHRGEFHAQRVTFCQGCWRPEGCVLLLTKEAAERAGAGDMRILGPGVRRWFTGGTDCFPTARHVGILGWSMNPATAPEEIEPIYMRATVFVKAPPPRTDLLEGAG